MPASVSQPGLPGGSRALEMVRSRRWVRRTGQLVLAVFVALPFVLLFVPWQQHIAGAGRVVAFAPLDRQQSVKAPIGGRVVRVWVLEGAVVAAGDPLVEISDIDPDLIARLEQERAALLGKLGAYEAKLEANQLQIESLTATRDLAVASARFRVETARERVRVARENRSAAEAAFKAAELQFERKQNLLPEGVISQRDYDLAERDVEVARTTVNSADAQLAAAGADLQGSEADLERARTDGQARVESANAAASDARSQLEDARVSLANLEVRLARQRSQQVTAPRDGSVYRVLVAEGGEIVRPGDPLLTLVPDAGDRAVELWIDGNDAPLVSADDPVRLQFEGWPAVQFAGWPSVAVGTFGGRVTLIDSTDDGFGRFRLLVTPDPAEPVWPELHYLRQGVRAKGWVLLKQVPLGYEVWRQLNGFPPVVQPADAQRDIARKRLK